eukprot:TRINITY_DN1385_c0_g1_i1.p1 TRINITY_DN1385_c0_g1~~TRINITY_DN1385_c0_g1_i1.p1  ORF type:complete len:477 (-),score=108.79 TRINITY_DN1385_c0_g1_i1:582-1952(-)
MTSENKEDSAPESIFEKGEVTDSKYAHGPVEDRSCTDIICCLVFVAFIAGMVYVTCVAFTKGEPVRLLAPYASDNQQCGFDSHKSEDYLFIPRLMDMSLNVKIFEKTSCVSECPSSDKGNFHNSPPYNSEPFFGRYCLPNAKDAIKKFFDAAGADKVGQYLSDLYSAWKVLLLAILFGFVFSLVYMVLVRCCAKVLVWVTLLAFIVLLAVMGYLFFKEYRDAVDEGDELNYLVLAILFWSFDGLFLLMIFCCYDDIQTALAVITAAARFVFSNFFILLVPIIAIIVTCAYIAYWIATIVFIYSIGDKTQYNNTPFSSVEWDSTTNNLWYYQLVALVWIIAFFISVLQFVIAATAAQWYFSSNSDQSGSGSLCKSLYWAVRYHLGSLGFGSLILTIVVFVRFIFEYMKKKVEKGGPSNKFTKCLLSCASCCLKCIGECILFLTKNAYIQVKYFVTDR